MNRRIVSETVYYGIGKYSSTGITLLTTAVLARLISPEEHGVVAVVTVFTSFFAVLADMGLGTGVIQNKKLTQSETNDIFSFSVYIAIALGALFALMGIPIALFYRNDEYRIICVLLSVSVFFQAINIIPNAILMKNKKFKIVGFRMIFVSIVVGSITVIMAYRGLKYYALVFQSILQSFLVMLLNMKNVNLRFHFFFQTSSIAKIRSYSMYQFCYSLINYFARNLDNLLIGKHMGNEFLGYYDKGYKLMMYPVQNLTYVIDPVLHPILSEYQDEKRRIYDSYIQLARILSVIGSYVTVVCFVNSREIILLFFGFLWLHSVPVFRLLSVSVWPQMIVTSAGAVYQSTGNTRLMFKSGIIHFSVTIVMIVTGLLLGSLETVAVLVSVSLYLRFFIDYFFLIRLNFGYSYTAFLSHFFVDGILVTLAVCLACLLPKQLQDNSNAMFFLIKLTVITLVFLIVFFKRGQHLMVMHLLNGRKKGE